jgi:GNAT superfamily N-acetyltransferase
MRIDVVDSLGETELDTIRKGLSRHAADAGVEPRNHRPLNVVLRTDSGDLLGGLVAATVWGWLEVSLLWVSEDRRGEGHGGRLLTAAEAEARHRGCHHAVIDTFSFQAGRFYERHGYRTFGTLADFPRGQQRIYLAKEL